MLEHILLLQQFFQLLETLGHKEQFKREGKLLGIGIKLREKRVVGKFFQYQSCIIMFAEQMRKGRFTRSDIAFYSNEIINHGSLPQSN